MSDALREHSDSPPDVDVWRIELDEPALDVGALIALLSENEQQRAARYRFDDKRRQFIVTRAALRRVLARAMDADPAALRFVAGAYGKPALPGDANPLDLRFNVSHTDGLALIALTPAHPVGVDVERVRESVACDRLAERFFSAAECGELTGLRDEHERRRAFFRCWTCKEAYVKAIGRGFAAGLDAFDVSVGPAAPARLVATRPDEAEAVRWRLFDLDVGRDYAAALAVRSPHARVRMHGSW